MKLIEVVNIDKKPNTVLKGIAVIMIPLFSIGYALTTILFLNNYDYQITIFLGVLVAIIAGVISAYYAGMCTQRAVMEKQ
jgi:xanthine/uracil permease